MTNNSFIEHVMVQAGWDCITKHPQYNQLDPSVFQSHASWFKDEWFFLVADANKDAVLKSLYSQNDTKAIILDVVNNQVFGPQEAKVRVADIQEELEKHLGGALLFHE